MGISVTADKTLFSDKEELEGVINDITDEINKLGARTIPPAKIDPDRKPPAWLDFNLARKSLYRWHRHLLLSGNFSTPASATKRYTSTITEIITWYTDPFWESGSDGNITDIYKSLNRVRALHSALACAASKKISRGEILSDAMNFSDYAPTAAWAAAKEGS
ncbi:hypothetical protein Fcan01_28671 [Folsomia candida]|uniref:Uncharacterized protein n=1 Tax=Folsomia candida TaxID=158441 RepID=A0A226CVB6_FOLCA|nr:hypothetical protein Fcan01_28671 [Folsomia candida]